MFNTKYKVNYHGYQALLRGAKDAYAPGETVTLYFNLIATDTRYTFYVDNKEINPGFDENNGIVISFTMPAHDVSLNVKEENLMLFVPEKEEKNLLVYESFDGGGPAYTVTVEDTSVATCKQTHLYFHPDHDQMCGSGYEVHLTFTGCAPGTTTAKVECRSPIADNFDEVYSVTVSDALEVTLTLLTKTPVYRQ